MPWRERSAMDEKTSFVFEVGESTVSALCEAFGISRTLAYRYIGRYLQEGPAGLAEQSRARGCGTAPPRPGEACWSCREATARSAERLLERLRERFPARNAGGLSSFLRRNGLVKKRRVSGAPRGPPCLEAGAPNDIWSVDFKGEFRMGNMRYCYPLTVMDAYSRYVLVWWGCIGPPMRAFGPYFKPFSSITGCRSRSTATTGSPSPAR